MHTCADTDPRQRAMRCPLPTKVQALRSTGLLSGIWWRTAELQAGRHPRRYRALTLIENCYCIRLVFLQVADDSHRVPVHSAAALVR